MTYFDASTWTGPWPFAFCEQHSSATLAATLRRHGIGRALVSPLEAVFALEPGPANEALLRATRTQPALVPVPVINPALANWREELAKCAADSRVRAVRILPNYHDYRLRSPRLTALVAELTQRDLRLIIQMQMIDPRHEFHALTIKPVPPADLAAFLQQHADLRVLACGLGRSEVRELLPKHPRLLADLSFAEWHDTVKHLLTKVSPRQLVFGSHTPLLITAANRAKVDTATAPAAILRAIAAENLERFLR